MSATYETIRVDDQGGGLTLVTLNRPDVANAMNTQMGRDILAFFDSVNADPLAHRCIVLTGAGNGAFCAGGDLKERHGMTNETWLKQHALFERMTLSILDCPIPVICAVHGAAYAGGCEIALTCDFIYADTNARFALTEVTLGIMPGGGGTQFLPRAVGLRRAKEIILTGKPFGAQEALDWGVVNKLCPPDRLMAETLATAKAIAGNAPISIRQAKRSMHFGQNMDLRSALFFEVDVYNKMVSTEDRLEGIRAFNEKRKPAFKGK